MTHSKTSTGSRKRGARLYALAATAGFLLLTGCLGTTTLGSGDCPIYAEARLDMPREPVPGGAWGEWIADTDDRMTGACT